MLQTNTSSSGTAIISSGLMEILPRLDPFRHFANLSKSESSESLCPCPWMWAALHKRKRWGRMTGVSLGS